MQILDFQNKVIFYSLGSIYLVEGLMTIKV